MGRKTINYLLLANITQIIIQVIHNLSFRIWVVLALITTDKEVLEKILLGTTGLLSNRWILCGSFRVEMVDTKTDFEVEIRSWVNSRKFLYEAW